MKLGIRRGLLMGLALLGVLTMEAVPAGATAPINVGAGIVQGTGTIAPGLHATPAQQFFTFTSVGITTVGIGHPPNKTPTVLGTSQCAANGLDGLYIPGIKTLPTAPLGEKNGWPGDSLLLGTGLGFWGCGSGPLAGKGGLLYYTRVGPIVTVTLTKHVPTAVTKDTPMGALVCVFVAVETPPALVQNYTLTCAGALADLL